MPLKFSPTILALAALLSAPALAQYDAPPRPPGSIDYPPGQQPYPDQRPNPDQRYPRAQPYPPPQPNPPQARDPRYDPRDPRAVQSQPLAPPPGTQPQPAPRQDTRQVLPPPGYDAPPAQPKAKAKAEPKSKTAPKQTAPAQDAPEAAEVAVEQAPVQRISNPTAVVSGLDKITGRIISFEAAIDETVQFGALQVTPRACYTRPPTEIQNTTAFVEVDEITLAGDIKRIFTGWMFANSPGLNAVEHPIYDVWITDCKTTPPAIAQSGGKQ
jgi:hypothetical protein